MRRERFSLFENWGDIRADYDAAKTSKFRRKKSGIPGQGAGADWHYRNINDLLRMIEWARDFDRNSPIIAQALDRVCDNVQPDLFDLEPMTGDTKLDSDIKAKFIDWADDPDQCDAQGRRTLSEIIWQSLRHTILDGDCAHLLNEAGFIEPIEAHRMRGPSSAVAKLSTSAPLGIATDRFGKPTNYYFTRSDFGFGGMVRIEDIVSITARDDQDRRQVLHLMPQRRFSQNRGVTFLAPVFDMLGFHDDLQFSALVAAQVQSCFAILEKVEPDKTPGLPSDPLSPVGSRTTETQTDGSERTLESIVPGMRIRSKNTLTGFSPTVPGVQFFEHVKLVLTFVSINLGLPLHTLLLDPSQSNFSSWRGSEEAARKGFKVWQRWLINTCYEEIYRWKLRQFLIEEPRMAAAADRRKINIFKHTWKPTGYPYIDPNKDAQAASLRMATGQASPSDIHGECGGRGSWSEHNERVMRERGDQILAALDNVERIKAKFSEADVSWRDFPIATAQGTTVSQAFSESESTSETVNDQTTKQSAGSKA